MKWHVGKIVTIFLLLLLPLFGDEAYEQEIKTAFAAAEKVMEKGPQQIKVFDQATLDLPEKFIFIPNPEATNIMRAMGNPVSEGFAGMILPEKMDTWWFITVNYDNAGYIKDDDAKNWKSDEMLQQMKENAVQINEERVKRHMPEVDVAGWVQTPMYYGDNHEVIWSVATKAKGVEDDQAQGVNYNTLVLGRQGYIGLNLITSLASVESLKPTSKMLIDQLHFVDGKRYSDVNFDTDKIAEYGLAALITGAAAKKLGLIALAAAFLAKFAKVIALTLFGGTLWYKKWAAKKKQKETASTIDTTNKF
ncbi:DUF2167 domain-containing protein [Sulfuricurvum sp.]|uniref:DUF2167 domain-containing protein n=1 Tax=Sulfuricurvum sp. TaxID=2025608 RepID=UPI00262F0955|nr:DUF2167 domain-containing protein [Sulfuricurvum sp.]MDD2266850.1 DUF2167 domain-containing protein [Sulfuricurvum sp.]MDD2783845.1 DUF2167 domain-containing protein [Sulfuricurvum sp.]